MDVFLKILSILAPVLVAAVGIIPTIKSNRKKTEESIKKTEQNIKASNEATDKRIDKMQESFDAHVSEYEDGKARNMRYRILRFYDEMCEHRDHSESHFEDILDDIDEYEVYCENHPEFKNNRGRAAMEYIKVQYPKIKANGGFLMHKEDHSAVKNKAYPQDGNERSNIHEEDSCVSAGGYRAAGSIHVHSAGN